MNTPVVDFVRRYGESGISRLHMPGHKGQPFLGFESWDITEIQGADALFEAEGILRESEENATGLFGSRRTFYSTEGSSHCIRAMLYLALTNRPAGAAPLVVAARNVHRAFVSAAALLDLEVAWLWPEESRSLCGCPISPRQLEETLKCLPAPPAAVYLTSPDYLGGMGEIAALSQVCHRFGTLLAVDNAHGAYLRFLSPSLHPLDLGADLCCDSAHKTLPVLTGGAYLHIAKTAPASLAENGKTALALFGSTSPSYLTLCSLDQCNRYLAEGYPARLQETAAQLEAAFAAFCTDTNLAPVGITVAASIDLKQNEPGLLEFCRSHGWPVSFYSAAQLRAVPGTFSASRFVQGVTGVDNVCERAAVLASGGTLLLPKYAHTGVTFAAAVRPFAPDWRWKTDEA